MASCTLVDTSITATRDYQDTVIYKYQADLGQNIANPRTAMAIAQSLGPNPLPIRRAVLAGSPLDGASLYVNEIHGERTKEHREVWMFDVSFAPAPKGEDEDQQNENPLLRPPVFGVRYIEEEYVVKQARNVQSLGVDIGAGGPFRAAGTLGPIVNGASRRPDEPIVRTRRRAVITIAKNFADLGTIMDMNEDYQDTTNSDSVVIGNKTFSPRRLKYEVTEDGGKQVENNITFYPGLTEIGIHKTTDLILDNVGFEYYTGGGADNKLIRAKDDEGLDTAEPVNLSLEGFLILGTTQITYRDLEEVAYSGFFS